MTDPANGVNGPRGVAPLIGVTGKRATHGSEVPAAVRGLRIDVHVSAYAEAITRAGGIAVQLSSSADPDALVRRLDGLVLAGGEDVDPATYRAPASPLIGLIDPSRDAFELSALHTARASGVPVLGVCRGAQLINVGHGGTLHGHLHGEAAELHTAWNVHHSTHRHLIRTSPGSALREVLGPQAAVNSLHHQAIDRVGDGLRVTAWAEDGTVEALESEDGLLLAVQWHPELHEDDTAVFGWLVDIAARRAMSRYLDMRRNVG